jgi:hypothetical protein
MAAIVLQPASGKGARSHYVHTIDSPVSLERIRKFLGEQDFEGLKGACSESHVPTWEVTPGEDGRNQKLWERIQAGDVALFSRDGRVISSGEIIFRVRCRPLAKDLWGVDEDGDTWEFMYFLRKMHGLNIPYAEFNKAADYKPNNVIQGFQILNDEKIEAVFAALELHVSPTRAVISEEEDRTLQELGALDVTRQGLARKEQQILRKRLFRGKDEGTSGVCGQLFPIELLFAAHIKRRAHCTDKGKRDISTIMPMCKFGCDDLFELGFIKVVKGSIRPNPAKHVIKPIQNYLVQLSGRSCSHWNTTTELYFEWRNKQPD